jgi:type IV secretion system protein TrbL
MRSLFTNHLFACRISKHTVHIAIGSAVVLGLFLMSMPIAAAQTGPITTIVSAPPVTQPKPSDPGIIDTIGGTIGGIFDPVGSIIEALKGAIGDLFKSMATALAQMVAEAAGVMLTGVINVINGTTAVSFGSGSWWDSPDVASLVGTISGVAGLCLVGFLLLAVIQGVINNDLSLIMKTLVREVPLTAMWASGFLILLTIGMSVVDEISQTLMASSVPRLQNMVEMFTAIAIVKEPPALMLLMFAMTLFILASMLVYIMLLVRSSLIVLLAAVSPLFIAARVWPSTRSSFKKLGETVVALVLSKLMMAISFSLGSIAMNESLKDPNNWVNGLMVGLVLMVLAAFSPWMLMKIIPGVEGAVGAGGIAAGAAAAGGLAAAKGGKSAASMLSGGGEESGGGGGGGSGGGGGGAGGAGKSAASKGAGGGSGGGAAAAGGAAATGVGAVAAVAKTAVDTAKNAAQGTADGAAQSGSKNSSKGAA